MFWTLMLMSIFPIFQLDRFTRRDIRKYNRVSLTLTSGHNLFPDGGQEPNGGITFKTINELRDELEKNNME